MKKIIILEEAAKDLEAAFDFYENQEQGAGEYFTTNLLADIEKLSATAGIHRLEFGFLKSYLKNFHSQFIIKRLSNLFMCMLFWIYAKTHHGQEMNSRKDSSKPVFPFILSRVVHLFSRVYSWGAGKTASISPLDDVSYKNQRKRHGISIAFDW